MSKCLYIIQQSCNVFPGSKFMSVYVFQGLPSASAEFHSAASSTFLTILEKKLVHPYTFTQTFLQGILSSIDSRDPGADKLLLYIFTYTYISSLLLYSIIIRDFDTGFLLSFYQILFYICKIHFSCLQKRGTDFIRGQN
jgi:hypothetical protein